MADKRVTVDDWLKEELRDDGFRLRWDGRKVAYRAALATTAIVSRTRRRSAQILRLDVIACQ